MNWILVAIGGAGGAVTRYGVGLLAGRWLGHGWPWGTLTVNIFGGLLMGVLAGWLALKGGAEQASLRALLGVGVLGGFTTFSAFSLETVLMIERREWAGAMGYVTASVALSLGALMVGLWVARKVL